MIPQVPAIDEELPEDTLNHPPTAERVQHIRRSCMHAVYFTDIAGRSEVVTIMPKKIPSTCSNI